MAVVRIQLRRDTAANWTSADPTLAAGEIGIETDTDQLKIGDGATAWSSLGYGGIQGPAGTNGADGVNSVVAATSPITYDAGTSTVGFDFAAYDLNDVNDVAISSPVAGEALAYNGSQWVNQPAVTDSKPDTFLLMGA